ncbi:TetR family transcriptional regulator [Enemella sp. A6]|uniref:TetR family transcriptional regulator n=1 Tax=Enemella sp. A6 TaxID=3440152 RepID=UPI003EBB534A
MGLRERKKVQTRRRIVDAALNRFVEQGYEATTVEEIAGDADISVTTFFRYFRAKDEVLFADSDHWAPEVRSLIEQRPADESDLEAIHQALRTFHEQGGVDDDARRMQRHRVTDETPVLSGRAQLVAARWKQEVAAALAERRGVDMDDRDVHLLAAISFTILRFAEDEWYAGRGSVDWLTSLDAAFDRYARLARA